MKLRLLDLLACRKCQKSFTLNEGRVERNNFSGDWRNRLTAYWEKRKELIDPNAEFPGFEAYEKEIMSGTLSCDSCGDSFDIENGIPVILPEALKTERGKMGRGNPLVDTRIDTFMDETKRITSDDEATFDQVQKANQSNYGYEWQAFSHEYEGWEKVYDDYYVFEDPSFFPGKIGLDGGCGMGRFPLVSAGRGAEMVGVDLSNAVEASYRKSRECPLFHCIQGDVFNLPFKRNFFDFAQTLGVIHITPDPEAALQEIKSTVQDGNKVWVYVYPSFKDENKFRYYALKLVNQLRRLTVKIPANILYYLLYPVTALVVLTLYWPSTLLWKMGLKKLALIPPYNYEQYVGRPIRDIHMNLFDRFGNPVERRYHRSEMEDWMDRAGFKNYELWFKDGWTVGAVK